MKPTAAVQEGWDFTALANNIAKLQAGPFVNVADLRPFVADFSGAFSTAAQARRLGGIVGQESGRTAALSLAKSLGATQALASTRLSPLVNPANLAAARESIAMPAARLEGVVNRVAAMLAHAQTREIGTAAVSLSRLLGSSWQGHQHVAAEVVARWVERQRRDDARVDEFVQRHGWPLPNYLPEGGRERLLQRATASRREVNALVADLLRPRAAAQLALQEILLTSPSLESRRPLLRQALRAMRSGDWYLVVNGLLPLVEGTLIDLTFTDDDPPPKLGRTQSARDRLRSNVQIARDIRYQCFETVLLSATSGLALFDQFDQTDFWGPREPRGLNRNAILHGAARRYGTGENARRLALLLAVIAEIGDDYARARSQDTLTTTGRSAP